MKATEDGAFGAPSAVAEASSDSTAAPLAAEGATASRVHAGQATSAPSLSGRILRSVLALTLSGIVLITLMFAGIFSATMMQVPNSAAVMADFFGSDLTVCVVATLIVGAALALAVSRALTASIMKPLDNIDPADPWKVPVYAEMRPLLTRIDSQQRTLRAQNEELARAESLRRDFSANVSHEMKTPLQVISGYAELMENGLVPPEDVPRFAGLIHQESQAMRALIDDVLTLSRLDELPPDAATAAPVQVLGVARRAAERLAKVGDERDVTVQVAGAPATVMGNEGLMEQMLYNLIENAIRYNEQGGHVWVETASGPDAVTVRVSDDGPGIPEAKREKIFERFYRLEKSRSKETGGTGLGLAIVKHGVQRHGGTIEVGGREGEGAVFTLRFPTAPGA